jgi:tRNA modification GTPase
MEDTIAAISTPLGEGGIAIVRVSGAGAVTIADRLFFCRQGAPSRFASHTIHFGTVGVNGTLVDQVMLTVMRAPRTYTGEDTVEINCHGGILTARTILGLCLQHGARLAEPGEFTKRAFLAGRIDLAQAEAVMDLIRARTERAHSAAVHALQGRLSQQIELIRDRLVSILAHIEAHIDFPDEDITPDSSEQIRNDIRSAMDHLRRILETAREGRILREGIHAVIVGRPNAGKSSLMNALLGHDRSIVAPVPGTTRDTVDEIANIRGVPVRLTDTAGIRRARGRVESLGVERSRNALQRSQLVIHILDGSRSFSQADAELAGLYVGKPAIMALNKIDLRQRLVLPDAFRARHCVAVSATRGDGLEDLKIAIEEVAWSGQVGSTDIEVAVNERQADALRRANNSLTDAVDELDRGSPPEIVSQQLRLGLDAVGEIVGKTATDDILDKIFSTFCIGK